MKTIDLNADVGELPDLIKDGTQEAVMSCVSSVNVACGGHAGDEASITQTLLTAKRLGLAIGAHPSFPDRKNFGRNSMNISSEELERSLIEQIQFLQHMCKAVGVSLEHVKPHGALYNLAATDEALSKVICESVQKIDSSLSIVGLAGSKILDVVRAKGLRAIGEAFVDRRYEADGSLRSRQKPNALITDPIECLAQAKSICGTGIRTVDGTWISIEAQTLCVHSDTSGAATLAAAIRNGLTREGIKISAPSNHTPT
jgi:5-oxoprolinase (ATP-hydrolysing) subunit A